MNPFMAGSGMKLATQPMRSRPKTRKNTPTAIASADDNATTSLEPCEARAPTVTPEMSAVAESGPMTMVREVPKIA